MDDDIRRLAAMTDTRHTARVIEAYEEWLAAEIAERTRESSEP